LPVVEIHPECVREDLGGIADRRIAEGILRKIAALGSSPELGKPLRGPLAGHRRTTYGRYRIVYAV
jgi:mRNA-degrading endonuclease RelE of RelBE toxin-antitoxin system